MRTINKIIVIIFVMAIVTIATRDSLACWPIAKIFGLEVYDYPENVCVNHYIYLDANLSEPVDEIYGFYWKIYPGDQVEFNFEDCDLGWYRQDFHFPYAGSYKICLFVTIWDEYYGEIPSPDPAICNITVVCNSECCPGRYCSGGTCVSCTGSGGGPCPSGVCTEGHCTCSSPGQCAGGMGCVNALCQPCTLNSHCKTCYDCENGTCVSKWSTGPGITGASIKKQYDLNWFHINQICGLRAKGQDYDNCRNVTQPTDYIDLEATHWEGSGISSIIGEEIYWSPVGPTGISGVKINAQIDDDSESPDGLTSDDAYATAEKQMYAFEATSKLTWYYPGGSSSTPIRYETDASGILDSGWLSLGWGTTTVNDGQTANNEKFGNAVWTLGYNPTDAVPGQGEFQVGIGAETFGSIKGVVNGSIYNPTTSSISVAFSGITISITSVIAESEYSNGNCGIGFLFKSPTLGEVIREIELCSAITGYGGERYVGYDYNNSATWRASYPTGDFTTTANALIKGEIKCKGGFNPYRAMMNSSGDGVKYTVGVPAFVGDLCKGNI